MLTNENKNEYQEFADRVQKLLRDKADWRKRYAGYAKDLRKNIGEMADKRGTFHVPNPLRCYTTIGAIKGDGAFDFDLRYLGQSVGTITVKNEIPLLTVSNDKAKNSQIYFGYSVGEISNENWKNGKLAQAFRKHYMDLAEQVDVFPRQKEHMVESALFSELEKEFADTKALSGIQPITCVNNVRLHMKTALRASDSSGYRSVDPTLSDSGGEIDVFCRRKTGNRSRLTVIEVKDENKSTETFDLAIKQAIAYAVFIRELARSDSGSDWMELWGMGNQPWEKEFTINAVVAMPQGETSEFPFAGKMLDLSSGGVIDHIELHYMAFQGNDKPRDGQDVDFESSLN